MAAADTSSSDTGRFHSAKDMRTEMKKTSSQAELSSEDAHDAAACPAGVSGVGELLAVGILLSSVAAA